MNRIPSRTKSDILRTDVCNFAYINPIFHSINFEHIMKTRLPKGLLIALLFCASPYALAAFNATDGKNSFKYEANVASYFTITKDTNQSTLTYRGTTGQISITGATIDATDYQTFIATHAMDGYALLINNSKITANDVVISGNAQVHNKGVTQESDVTEISADNISLEDKARIHAISSTGYKVKLTAKENFTVTSTGTFQSAEVTAGSIEMKNSSYVNNSNFTANNISLDNVAKNAGVIDSNFKAEGGTISMKDSKVTISEGKSMLAAIIELESGSLTNAGTIEGELQMSGGTFTMVDGAVAGALTATSGTINISGEVTFTGEVNLGSDVVQFSATGEGAPLTINIEQGSTITMEDVALNIASGVVFNVNLVDDAQMDAGEALFTIDYGSNDPSAVEEQLSQITTTLSYDGAVVETYEPGSLQVGTDGSTSIVPEPATATLSLLALAALAARRRRK